MSEHRKPRWRCRIACAFAFTAFGSADVLAQQSPLTAPDTMAQRLLACTPCHGEQGISTNTGYLPRIAGKPAGSLTNQLLNFREGRRNNAAMSRLTATFTDSYMEAIAEHFATLELPYPAPRPPTVSAAVLARGRNLVEHGDPSRELPACIACHGRSMMGVAPAVPGLLGLPADYLLSQLGAWRTGLRRAQAPDCMQVVAKRLDGSDLTAVTAYLAAQPVDGTSKPERALPTPLPLACGGLKP